MTVTVAVDVDAIGEEPPGVEAYINRLVGALLGAGGAVGRVTMLTNAQNHARFETLRDERCDVAMINRPLFAGRTVVNWPDLLAQYPRAGADVLAGHLQEKLRVIRDLGVNVVHFPAEAGEGVNVDVPVVVSLHDWASGVCPISARLAHAVLVESVAVKEGLCGACGVAAEKTFVAAWRGCGRGGSLDEGGVADDGQEAFAAAVREAYEHAMASFELRKAA